MRFETIDKLVATMGALKGKGTLAVVLVEDEIEIDTTLRHNQQLGFDQIVALMPAEFDLARDLTQNIIRVDFNTSLSDATQIAIDALNAALPGVWIYYCYNAEYLFYPFCETRTIGEVLAFHAEERRDAMLTYVIDLYADDLEASPTAVSLDSAHLDRSGYYALARADAANHGHPKERQLDFFGGLRWRYEEHIPAARRKIDRIAIFRAKPELKLREDHTFNDEEYNTYACPWHHNITATICSFRTAKALKSNPGSTYDIHSFNWHNSAPFEWHSRQLMDLGLMEPGQWF